MIGTKSGTAIAVPAVPVAPVSYENRDPPNWGPWVPIFIEKWGPGSLFSYDFRDPWVPIFIGFWGPSYENGDPQCNTVVGINID